MPLQERPADRSRNLRYGRGHICEASRPPAARPAASVSAERQAHTATFAGQVSSDGLGPPRHQETTMKYHIAQVSVMTALLVLCCPPARGADQPANVVGQHNEVHAVVEKVESGVIFLKVP